MTLVAAVLTAGAAFADSVTLDIGAGPPADTQGFITREWTWTTGGTVTTFTAYGPSDQVNRLDPRDRTPDCQGCELASSIQFEPEDETAADLPR